MMEDKTQRIMIRNVAITDDGSSVHVEIHYEGKAFDSKAASEKDEDSQMMAATKAVVDAVNSVIPTPIITRVTEIQKINFKELSEPVVVVLVGIKIKGKENLYTGSAKFNGAPLYAAVRATLDAVNRPLGLFL